MFKSADKQVHHLLGYMTSLIVLLVTSHIINIFLLSFKLY